MATSKLVLGADRSPLAVLMRVVTLILIRRTSYWC